MEKFTLYILPQGTPCELEKTIELPSDGTEWILVTGSGIESLFFIRGICAMRGTDWRVTMRRLGMYELTPFLIDCHRNADRETLTNIEGFEDHMNSFGELPLSEIVRRMYNSVMPGYNTCMCFGIRCKSTQIFPTFISTQVEECSGCGTGHFLAHYPIPEVETPIDGTLTSEEMATSIWVGGYWTELLSTDSNVVVTPFGYDAGEVHDPRLKYARVTAFGISCPLEPSVISDALRTERGLSTTMCFSPGLIAVEYYNPHGCPLKVPYSTITLLTVTERVE